VLATSKKQGTAQPKNRAPDYTMVGSRIEAVKGCRTESPPHDRLCGLGGRGPQRLLEFRSQAPIPLQVACYLCESLRRFSCGYRCLRTQNWHSREIWQYLPEWWICGMKVPIA